MKCFGSLKAENGRRRPNNYWGWLGNHTGENTRYKRSWQICTPMNPDAWAGPYCLASGSVLRRLSSQSRPAKDRELTSRLQARPGSRVSRQSDAIGPACLSLGRSPTLRAERAQTCAPRPQGHSALRLPTDMVRGWMVRRTHYERQPTTAHPRQSREPNPSAKRLLLLLIAGLLLVAAVGLYLHFWFRLPVGAGPAGPTVEKEAFAHAWTKRPVLLVGLGDSVTAGFGAGTGTAILTGWGRTPRRRPLT